MRSAFVKAGLGKACFFTCGHAAAAWRRVGANMRQPLCVSALAALFAMPAAIAEADSWCIRDKDGVIAPICAFSSSADCVHAALSGPPAACAFRRGRRLRGSTTALDKPGKRRYRREADRYFPDR
jgi:hypothetical protein